MVLSTCASDSLFASGDFCAQYKFVIIILIIIIIIIIRPDGATLIPWTRGKPLAWDITVADTYANSYVDSTATRGGSSRPSSFKQNGQVHRAFQDPPLHSNCN